MPPARRRRAKEDLPVRLEKDLPGPAPGRTQSRMAAQDQWTMITTNEYRQQMQIRSKL